MQISDGLLAPPTMQSAPRSHPASLDAPRPALACCGPLGWHLLWDPCGVKSDPEGDKLEGHLDAGLLPRGNRTFLDTLPQTHGRWAVGERSPAVCLTWTWSVLFLCLTLKTHQGYDGSSVVAAGTAAMHVHRGHEYLCAERLTVAFRVVL